MKKNASKSSGFTLIELVVVIGVLGLILGATITLINPSKQIEKAKLAQKESDLEQIKTALDLYYDDNKCYPMEGEIPFGSSWQNGSSIYMKKVPSSSDPEKFPYKYETGGACPQWYVLFAKIDIQNSGTNAKCPLSQHNCHPSDDISNHICVYGGTVDCEHVFSTPLND